MSYIHCTYKPPASYAMNTQLREILNTGSIDADSLLERCMGNEAFMIKLLEKFLQDATYARLDAALLAKDLATAREAAHTLKGLCGNLAMTRLFDLLDQQMQFLRAGNMSESRDMMPGIACAHAAAITAIETCLAACRKEQASRI